MLKKIFFIILCLGLIGSICAKDRTFSEYENRYLEQAPSFSFAAVGSGSFFGNMDNYVCDQFVLRDIWVHTKTLSDKDVLQKKMIHDVYLGKSDYLIARYTEKDVDNGMVQKNISYLNAFQKKYDADVILIPTASEVITDMLPDAYSHLNQADMLRDVHTSLDAGSVLAQHRTEDIYYRTDHHWTLQGAYRVYEEYVEEPLPFKAQTVSKNFYGTNYKKVPLSNQTDSMQILDSPNQFSVLYDNTVVKNSLYEPTYLQTADPYSFYLDGNHGLTEITNKTFQGSKKESILVIKDSFANTFATLLCNHYASVYLVDLRYFNGSIEDFAAQNEVSDVLFLYNQMNFMQDKNLVKLLQ